MPGWSATGNVTDWHWKGASWAHGTGAPPAGDFFFDRRWVRMLGLPQQAYHPSKEQLQAQALAQVGIGTLASTAFIEMLLDTPVETLDIEKCVAAWKSWEETEKDIYRIFDNDPEFVARGLVETKGKYVDKEGLRRQLQRLKKAWPELSVRIRRQIIPFGEVRRRLELVGAPYEPEQIGVSRARFRASFEKIPYMRSRFTVIDIAFRCGWMEQWLDKLFGKGGIWEIK